MAINDPFLQASLHLEDLRGRLGHIIIESGHGEMWGVTLSCNPDHIPTTIVLQKFLRANARARARNGENGNPVVEAAAHHLMQALVWRRTNRPANLLDEVIYDADKFEGLGYVTIHETEAEEPALSPVRTVITWTRYGVVKDNKRTFGDVNE